MILYFPSAGLLACWVYRLWCPRLCLPHPCILKQYKIMDSRQIVFLKWQNWVDFIFSFSFLFLPFFWRWGLNNNQINSKNLRHLVKDLIFTIWYIDATTKMTTMKTIKKTNTEKRRPQQRVPKPRRPQKRQPQKGHKEVYMYRIFVIFFLLESNMSRFMIFLLFQYVC